MGKVVGIGEMVLDIVFRDGQPQAAVPGGSVFNSLVSLGRTFDGKVLMVSQVGDDMVADRMFAFMASNGVSSDCVARAPKTQSTVSIAMLDSRGDAHYEFYRDRTAPPFEAPQLEFNPDDIVLFGSFFAVDDVTREQTRSLVRAAREAGATVYYDINFRKNHLSQLEHLIPEIEENCSLATIVRGSSEDIACVYGIADASEAYSRKISSLCPQFIFTRGGEDAEVFVHGKQFRFPVPEVEVVSTIGAGDSFNAGFIRSLLDEPDSKVLTDAAVSRAVGKALSFSSAVCRSFDNYVPKQK